MGLFGLQKRKLQMNYNTLKIAASLMLLSIIPMKSYASEDVELTYEFESLVPMYFYGGYHLAAGVRYKAYRFRVSCIDGGNFDYEASDNNFERNLGTGCGVFAGYFLNENLHVYGYVENQSYIVTKRNSGIQAKFDVVDIGGGVGYQYFLTTKIYVQPALHLYWRKPQTKTIDGSDYTLRAVDILPTVRIGYQF